MGFRGGDHPIRLPVFPFPTAEIGEVGGRRSKPRLEVVAPDLVLALPGLHQHEEIAEEGDAGLHPHKHLAQVNENRHLGDGVGGEVLKLVPVRLQ